MRGVGWGTSEPNKYLPANVFLLGPSNVHLASFVLASPLREDFSCFLFVFKGMRGWIHEVKGAGKSKTKTGKMIRGKYEGQEIKGKIKGGQKSMR